MKGSGQTGKLIDVTGKRFGMWTVICRSGKDDGGRYLWACRCDCGTIRDVCGGSLRSGVSTCCGCTRGAGNKYNEKHGGKKERLYAVWTGMKGRCYNPNNTFYSRYGGRGISVCEEWRSDYSKFREWALQNGYDENAPKGSCTIDRIDNEKGYSPDNCRWVSMKNQCNNRSSNHLIEYEGESHTLQEWSDITGIRKDTLRRRLEVYNWPVQRAFSEPVHN